MSEVFRTERRVEFRDTDAAGIMHFSVYFTYMEQVEHEFWRHVGLSVQTEDEQGLISWPRVAASCDYVRPARFEDVLAITLSVARLGEKSVTFAFGFSHDHHVVATGETTAVCCRIVPSSAPKSIPIPKWIGDKLAPYHSSAAN